MTALGMFQNPIFLVLYGYSVIEEPKAKGQQYQEKAAAKRGRSFQGTAAAEH